MRPLTAVDQLELAPGEALNVVTGDVIVFVQDGDGPRCPLLTLRPGDTAIGASAPSRGQLFMTGFPGTTIEVVPVGEAVDDAAPVLSEWIFRLNEAGRGDRWADRVIAPSGSPLRCAPGETVSSSADSVPLADRSIQGWLQITSGSARWCGVAGSDIGPLDVAVPITRGVWVTSGLRCFVADGLPPQTMDQWQSALDLVTRCVVRAALDRSEQDQAQRGARLAERQAALLLETQNALDALVAPIVGEVIRPAAHGSSHEAKLAAAEIVVRASGMQVPESLRDGIAADLAAGRSLPESVAAACTARARSIDLPARWWSVEGPALLGYRTDGRAVALLPSARGRILVDPTEPDARVLVTSELAAGIRHSAYEFVPVLPASPQSLRGLLRLATRGSGRDVAVILALTVVLGLASFVVPIVFGAITASFGSITLSSLVVLLAVLAIVLGATTLWRYVRSLALLRVRVRGTAVAAGAMWDRLVRLQVNWHEGRTLGSRMTQASAVTLAAATVPDATILALLDSFIIVGSLAAVATTNSALLITLAVLLICQIGFGVLLDHAVSSRVGLRVRTSSEANGRLVETMRAVNRLRISGAESRALRRWSQLQAQYVSADISLRRVTLVQGLVLGLWPLVTVIVMVAVTAGSGATYAEFITAQTAAAIATASVTAAILAINGLLSGRATLRELDDVLEAQPEGRGSGAAAGRLNGGLTLQDLVFRYSPQGPAVLDGVSLTITPGEHVAIVGGSGCGKTTLMRVLLGLEVPESGTIMVDGRDLASLDQPSVRRQVGCVLQSSSLLPGTIVQNVDMGRGLSRDQIWQALDAAAVGDDVRAMGLGLDTPVVDGGGTVSGGQRQRILIARALAGDPRMLVLDEATSALDNVTQGIVVETLDRLRLTRIVVAHRLSTIRHADRIVVLDAGRIVEEGDYEQLMALDGQFAELARRQLA